MMSLWRFAVGSILGVTAIASSIARQYVGPGLVNGDTFIHDPTVVKTPEGTYLAAYTGDYVQLKTSTDRTTWRNAGAAFPNGAPWTTPYTGGAKNLWAPDLTYANGQYYLYYSASTFGSSRSAIFFATSRTGASGSWTNHGLVIESHANSNYNAIDPNLIIDAQGRWWLSFGSFWSGIKIVELDRNTGKPINSNNLISIASRPDNGGAVEAPVIIRRGNYYYLWVSFDRCCNGAASTYRIMVGRSTSVTGPYVDKAGKSMMQGGGTQMLASHGSIHGPGHNAVFADGDGDVLVYHYYRNDGVAQLGINLIRYDNGWPVIY
ncbi:putative Arabinan endo-1,5-alpha-L-arabinosidase [Apiosordaria backusii]|uniref:Arabinan endo-1,5-alpha-L-arabinosidase n=1 Tax=Apiosordaria backusii TaxID=314023 RepID=A0AA40EIR3_9PEZI|nr:putative Arabinan endo-1,5-alpha-L-arabinosidase [Apiosordaria backusii]